MPHTRCGLCAFGASGGRDAPASYAFALCHAAAPVATVFDAANATALAEALPGVSAYCAECRCVTWLTRHADLQSGLLQMQADRARWRALHAALDAA
jgi:hypothetical protein